MKIGRWKWWVLSQTIKINIWMQYIWVDLLHINLNFELLVGGLNNHNFLYIEKELDVFETSLRNKYILVADDWSVQKIQQESIIKNKMKFI